MTFHTAPQIEDIYALSPIQEGMLFDILMHPGSPLYVEHVSVEIEGNVDPARLVRAWQLVAELHPALRTTFAWEDLEHPRQVVHRQATIPFRTLDWRGVSVADRPIRLDKLIEDDRRIGIDPRQPPLMRLTLISFDDDDHLLLWTNHHLILDAWSNSLVLRDVLRFYGSTDAAGAADRAPAYRAYVVRTIRRGTDRGLQFWRNELTGARRLPRLPHEQAAAGDDQGGHHELAVPDDLRRKLIRHPACTGLTINTLTQAAWAILLARHSGESDIVFGAAFSGRSLGLPGIECIVGPMIATLPVRVRLPSGDHRRNLDLSGWLRELQVNWHGLAAREQPPLVEIQAACAKPSGASLFDTNFIFQSSAWDPTGYGANGFRIKGFGTVGQSSYALTLRFTAGSRPKVEIVYRRNRFRPADIAALAEEYLGVLGQITDPDAGTMAVDAIVNPSTRRPVAKSMRLAAITARAVDLKSDSLVTFEPLLPDQAAPLVGRPALADVLLAKWMAAHAALLDRLLLRHGALLFRGFSGDPESNFRAVASTYPAEKMRYRERSTPRRSVGGDVYTSTEYPADQSIALHNEFSYARQWPMKILFCCVQAARRGGETPIADSRAVLRQLPSELVQRFVTSRLMYVRTYGQGIDLPWQEAFQTSDRAEVEAYCREAALGLQWKSDDQLKTWQVRDAVATHPKTGEAVFFNQAHLFHPTNLGAEVNRGLLDVFGEDNLPRNVRHADGSTIDSHDLELVRAAYARCSIVFPWQQGDVLLLDNMLFAHGRMPFEGQRRVLVSMMEPYALPPVESAEPPEAMRRRIEAKENRVIG